MVPKSATTPAAHSASLVALPGGERQVYWFGGSREGATDVQIWRARQTAVGWQAPAAVVNPDMLSAGSKRYIKKVGNPLLVLASDGSLHLYVVSVSFGGWAGSSLNRLISRDGGRSWGAAEKLITSPFFNLSTLARTHAVPLADGGYYLPVYHELLRKFPELLRFDAQGRLVDKIRMSSRDATLQPAVAAVSERQAFAYLRNAGPERKLLLQETLDGGASWSAPEALPLPNPDAAVAVERLADGRLLLAYNPLPEKRYRLALALSADGRRWRSLPDLARGDADSEFSYPSLWVDGERVDLAYTWNRRQIAHWSFNSAWLAAQGGTP